MKIYLTSSFPERIYLRQIADDLGQDGHEIVSDWIYIATSFIDEKDQRLWVSLNVQRIKESDLVIVFVGAPPSEGCWIELGYALGRKIPVFVVGQASTMFRFEPSIRWVPTETWKQELALFLRQWEPKESVSA